MPFGGGGGKGLEVDGEGSGGVLGHVGVLGGLGVEAGNEGEKQGCGEQAHGGEKCSAVAWVRGSVPAALALNADSLREGQQESEGASQPSCCAVW